MSSYQRQSNATKPNTEATLHDVLPTVALRVDLILLVALCTDSMRDCLQNAFDRSQAKSKANENADDVFWKRETDTRHTQQQRADVEWARDRDLSSARMQDLKANAVQFFNRWRTDVLRRMGDALKVKSDSVKRAKSDHVMITEAAIRAKMDQDFFDWAEGTESQDANLRAKPHRQRLPFAEIHTPGSLMKLNEQQRSLVLGSVLFMLLSLENYSAHSRVLLQYLCQSLDLPADVLSTTEATTALTLLRSVQSSDVQTDAATRKQAAQNVESRRWKVGLATVAGAVAIGVTGGLAAPLLLGAAGAIMGGVGLGGLATLLGATIANPVTVAALFGVLGGSMSGRAMEAYAKEVEDFKFLPVSESASNEQQALQKLRVVLGVSGWVTDVADVTNPWRIFSPTALETFALRYELNALIDLGTTLDGFLRDSAYTVAQAGALQLVLPVISAAMMPVGLLRMGKFLDNPFTIAMERSDKAGRVLAHALIDKAQGERPVTLIGFSLGARVVFSCLQELAARKAFALVDCAVLIGSPVPNDEMAWRRMRTVVVGRLVNIYSTNDMLLGYLYRARNIQLGVAGLQAIDTVQGIENEDVTDIVTGHNQYRLAIGRILRRIGFDDLDIDAVVKEEHELDAEKTREKNIHDDAKRKGFLKDLEDDDGRIRMVETDHSQSTTFEVQAGRQTIPAPAIVGTTGLKSSTPVDDLAGLNLSADSTSKRADLGPGVSIEDNSSDSTRPSQEGSKPQLSTEEQPSIVEDGDNDSSDESTDEDTGPIQMLDLEPDPLIDDVDDVREKRDHRVKLEARSSELKTVRFGSSARGFNLTWDEGR